MLLYVHTSYKYVVVTRTSHRRCNKQHFISISYDIMCINNNKKKIRMKIKYTYVAYDIESSLNFPTSTIYFLYRVEFPFFVIHFFFFFHLFYLFFL